MKQSKFESTTNQRVDVPALLAWLGINDIRRNGRSIEARCPHHPDKDPSWSIVDDPNSSRNALNHCFSCGFGGGAAALIREVKECSWEEAFAFLRDTPAQELPLEVDVVVTSYGRGVSGMRIPSEVKVRPFEEWPQSARTYLEERSITPAQVVRFDLGYALEGRLAGRIIFPMKSTIGRVESYTARDFTGQGKRYLEPQTSEGAQKSAIFGEHLWGDSEILIITEGCFDALAVDRFHNGALAFEVCALHGSRLHPIQAVKFSRFPMVIVATDPDPAGDAVAEEIAEALGRYSSVRRARPPVGQDCASMGDLELAALLVRALS